MLVPPTGFNAFTKASPRARPLSSAAIMPASIRCSSAANDTILRAQNPHAVKQCGACLLHLSFFGHRARSVDYEDHVLGRVFLTGPIVFGCVDYEEIALLSGFTMRQKCETEVFLRDRVEQLKILRLLAAFA